MYKYSPAMSNTLTCEAWSFKGIPPDNSYALRLNLVLSRHKITMLRTDSGKSSNAC